MNAKPASRRPSARTHRVWFLAFDRFQLLDICGPLQVFATANEILGTHGRRAHYATSVRGLAPGPVRSSSGVLLDAKALPKRLDSSVETLIIPGGPGVWEPGAERSTTMLAAWTRRSAPRVERLASVCTGAFVLARTGLLDGCRAVTHWAACERLAREFPAIDVQSDAIYFRHERYWTSAGVTAGIDMALGMVEADLGRELAMAVAKTLVVFFKRPGGQSQFSSMLLEQSMGDARIGSLHRWIASCLRHPLTVSEMAERLGMTPRTFARFYLRETGTTPARAVERIRLEHACRLIESRRSTLKAVAQQCGFSSEEVMRRSFVRHLRVSAADYRARFSGKLLSEGSPVSGRAS